MKLNNLKIAVLMLLAVCPFTWAQAQMHPDANQGNPAAGNGTVPTPAELQAVMQQKQAEVDEAKSQLAIVQAKLNAADATIMSYDQQAQHWKVRAEDTTITKVDRYQAEQNQRAVVQFGYNLRRVRHLAYAQYLTIKGQVKELYKILSYVKAIAMYDHAQLGQISVAVKAAGYDSTLDFVLKAIKFMKDQKDADNVVTNNDTTPPATPPTTNGSASQGNVSPSPIVGGANNSATPNQVTPPVKKGDGTVVPNTPGKKPATTPKGGVDWWPWITGLIVIGILVLALIFGSRLLGSKSSGSSVP